MKTIFIFIGLKIAEIAGVCAGIVLLYYLGMGVTALGFCPERTNTFDYFFKGFLSLLPLAFVFMIGVGLYEVIKTNWRWASKIARKSNDT